jgi:hypothetical protein
MTLLALQLNGIKYALDVICLLTFLCNII